MHLLMAFIDEWWVAIIWVALILVSLVEGVQSVRVRDYDQATKWFIGAEVLYPWLLIGTTPVVKVFPLPWIVSIIILCQMLGFVTVYLYARRHRRSDSF